MYKLNVIMFDFTKASKINNYISLNEIESCTTQIQLWKQYCKNFKDINESFLSELYNDTNPSCRLFYRGNTLCYKDFGTGETYNIYDYIQKKYNCTFKETLNIIINDLNLEVTNIPVERNIITNNYEEKLLFKPKSKITISKQAFNIVDYNYWSKYYIPLTLLSEYNVFSAKYVYLETSTKYITYQYTKNNPIYAYEFYNSELNTNVYKIYKPLTTIKGDKFLFSGTQNDIEGFDQLPLNGDLLILTKSLKDCMVYNVLGYNAISLQGETNKLNNDLLNKLLKRFEKIIVNYDNDNEGLKGSIRLKNQYNLKYFFIDEYKDISDYISNKGIEKSKKLIENKISNNNE